ncbi:MAG: hypothetical protein Q9166_003187 [cf. Caloplaca sp. 2 TL-2023]
MIQLTPSSESAHNAAAERHEGAVFVSPQSTGGPQNDNEYASSYLSRKNTAESNWSLQPGKGPSASGLTASGASPPDNASSQHANPSPSFIYEANDNFTSPRRDQNSNLAKDRSREQRREDFTYTDQGTYEDTGLSGDRGRGSYIHLEASPSAEQETKASSGHGEANPTTNNSDQAQRDDSFYWHSPQTSASTSHDRDHNRDIPGTSALLDATPEPQEQHMSAPPKDTDPKNISERTTSLYQSTLGPYSASALGFGGPSDWEHFGDYDGEEVDDTDLYIRPRSPTKQAASVDTPELPANLAPVVVQQHEAPITIAEFDKVASSAQSKTLYRQPHVESQPDKIQHNDMEGQSLHEHITNTGHMNASEQLDPTASRDGQETPRNEQQPDAKRSSAPTLPQLDFEQVRGEREPAPVSAKESSMNEIPHSLPKHQALVPMVLGDDDLPGTSEGNLVEELTMMNDELLAAKVMPSSEDQTQEDAYKPPRELAKFGNEFQDESQQHAVEHASDFHNFPKEGSMKRASLVSKEKALSKVKESNDWYTDLDPWAKASLYRYVTMLHEEARAATNQEKLDLFKVFSRKEWKLRAVLFGADDEQGEDLFIARKDGQLQRANTLEFRRPAFKALPALPPDADRSESEVACKAPLTSPKLQAPSLARLITTTEEEAPTRSSGEDSYVVVDTPGGRRQQTAEEAAESYSPGGRPIQAQTRNPRKTAARSLPDKNGQSSALFSVTSHDSKPAYTPFRYSQGYVDNADQPVDRRASFRPYAALRLEPVEDYAERAPEPVVQDPRPVDLPQSADDQQLQESMSRNEQVVSPTQRSSGMRNERSSLAEQEKSLDLRRFERADFDPLVAVLPSLGHIPHSAVEFPNLQRGMDVVPDDFGFIHQHVVAWDAKAKKIRGEHERERQMRQTESEQRIDALFNEDEIGYGDISELEEEFKKAEAARKTSEDRAEYSTFVEEVFSAVWTRLHFEIDQLTPLFDEYTGLAHGTLAGKDMFEAVEGQYALAPTMSALLTLHQKLEIRHQKAFEAVLERDRRLKKTEVAPWYTLGNVAKVKQLEKQFDRAEKKAIVEYCKQRDARANRLMDVLDQNTLRGVGANQDYMEAVMKAVRRIASGRAFASAPASEPGLGMDEVIQAKAVTAVLASSSEQIVQTFHVADMLLNAADYELSVATAKLANADSTTFERLKDERAAEDAKLMRDLQHRLALIREYSRRTNDEIVKLLCFLGVQGGHAQAGNIPSVPPNAESEHEQRLQKALEDAKRRNAQKAADGDGGS